MPGTVQINCTRLSLARASRDCGRSLRGTADDLVYVHSSGAIDSKASYIDALRTGKFRYTKCERFEEKVRMYGDAALVTGRAQFEALIEGTPKTLRLRYLNVWTMRADGWKFTGWQSCPLPA